MNSKIALSINVKYLRLFTTVNNKQKEECLNLLNQNARV